MDHLTLAIDHLSATALADARWAYYDAAAGTYWASSARALERLGAALQSKQPDAYSTWCSNTSAEQLPADWEPGDEDLAD